MLCAVLITVPSEGSDSAGEGAEEIDQDVAKDGAVQFCGETRETGVFSWNGGG